MNKDPYDGYTVKVYFEKEDDEWTSYFVEQPNISAGGSTRDESLDELVNAWELSKESYVSKNIKVPIAPSKRQYSGTFNVRVGKDLHKSLAMNAAEQGVSMNAYISEVLLRK